MSKTALITGASMGLGMEFAKLFAADGVNLILTARSREKLEALAEELKRDFTIDVTVIPADLSQASAPETLFKAVQSSNIKIDFLVNNAGFGTNGPFKDLPLEQELALLQVNIVSLVHLTKLFLPDIIATRGHIMNVASVAGFMAGPNMANYYASKSHVLLFSEALNNELKKTGVRVTAFCPGATRTNFATNANSHKSALFSNPFTSFSIMSAEKAARRGYRYMQKGKSAPIAGLLNKVMIYSLRSTPRFLATTIAGLMNK